MCIIIVHACLTPTVKPLPLPSPTELDALGDDFLADEDTSYLDEAVPEPPTTVPGGTERTKVRTYVMCTCKYVHVRILC